MKKKLRKAGEALFIVTLFTAVILAASWQYLPNISSSNAINKEVEEKATSLLDKKSVAKAYENYSDLLIEDSLPYMSEERRSSQERKFSELGIEHEQFGDAISTAYKAAHTDKDSAIKEFYQEILANPVFLYSACQWGIETELTSIGKTFGDLNPWMKDFIQITDQKGGISYWVKSKDGKLHVTDEYKVYAAAMKHLFGNFNNEGFQNASSHYHWAGNLATEPDAVRPQVMTYEDDLPWLVLVLRTKNGVAHATIGSNECDKRLGKLDAPKPQVPEPPNSPGNPPDSPPDNPNNPPGEVIPPPSTGPKKDESKNPVYHGNAEQGGSARPKTDEGSSQYQMTNPGRIVTDLGQQSSSSGNSTTPSNGNSPNYNGSDNETPPPTNPIPVDPDNQGGTDNGSVSDPDA